MDIAALPVEVMAALMTDKLKQTAPSLANLDKLKTRWMNGIQFYLSGRAVDTTNPDGPLGRPALVVIASPIRTRTVAAPGDTLKCPKNGLLHRRNPTTFLARHETE